MLDSPTGPVRPVRSPVIGDANKVPRGETVSDKGWSEELSHCGCVR